MRNNEWFASGPMTRQRWWIVVAMAAWFILFFAIGVLGGCGAGQATTCETTSNITLCQQK